MAMQRSPKFREKVLGYGQILARRKDPCRRILQLQSQSLQRFGKLEGCMPPLSDLRRGTNEILRTGASQPAFEETIRIIECN